MILSVLLSMMFLLVLLAALCIVLNAPINQFYRQGQSSIPAIRLIYSCLAIIAIMAIIWKLVMLQVYIFINHINFLILSSVYHLAVITQYILIILIITINSL